MYKRQLVNIIVGDSFDNADVAALYRLSSCGRFDADCAFTQIVNQGFTGLDAAAEGIACSTIADLYRTSAPTPEDMPEPTSAPTSARCELLDSTDITLELAKNDNCDAQAYTLDERYEDFVVPPDGDGDDKSWKVNVNEGDQWLVYDLGAAVDLAQVCVRWSTRDGWTLGARGVRVDVSDDGVAWTEGRVYAEADGLSPALEHVADPETTETIGETIRDSDCFDVDAATASFVRLWFGDDDMIPELSLIHI